jgi:RimJ/RimL family protein N-acetyltransferase
MSDSAAPDRVVVVPGDRIYLSQVLRSDLPLFAKWFADLELTAYIGGSGQSFMLEHEEQWFAQVVAGNNLKTFAIIRREDDAVIGSVSLQNIDYRHGTSELGIAIGDKGAWNQGYGCEAVRLISDFGFTFCGLNTIYLWLIAFNARAQRSYLKAGFKEAGRIRQFYNVNGKRYDRVLMDCTREDLGPSKLIHLIGQLDS